MNGDKLQPRHIGKQPVCYGYVMHNMQVRIAVSLKKETWM